MLISKIIHISLLCFPYILFAQEFIIPGSEGGVFPVTDQYGSEIYYQDDYTQKIYRTNSKGSYHIETDCITLPDFAHNSHKSAYTDIYGDICVYDFESNIKKILVNNDTSRLRFSPTDIKLICRYEEPLYYSFEDSAIHDPGIRLSIRSEEDQIDWSNTDTTFYYISWDPYYIIKYSYNSNLTDTLITTPDYGNILSLSYNPSLDLIAYSRDYMYKDSMSIFFYDIKTGKDSLVFDLWKDDPEYYGMPIGLYFLEWSPNNDKLAFVGNWSTVSGGDIYVYFTSTEKIYRLTNIENNYGLKYDLNWLNNDIVIYTKYVAGPSIYGFDTKYVSHIEKQHELTPDKFYIKNYPNPFNNQTIINLNLPFSGNIKIDVINTSGQIIRSIYKQTMPKGINNFDWDGTNQLGSPVSSGVYFIRAKLDKQYDSYYSKTIKTVYLK